MKRTLFSLVIIFSLEYFSFISASDTSQKSALEIEKVRQEVAEKNQTLQSIINNINQKTAQAEDNLNQTISYFASLEEENKKLKLQRDEYLQQKEKYQKLTEQLESLQKNIATKNESNAEALKQKEFIETEQKNLQQGIQATQQAIEELQKNIQEKQQTIAKLQENNELLKKENEELKTRLSALQLKLKELEEGAANSAKTFREKTDEIDKLKKQIEQYEEDKITLETDKEKEELTKALNDMQEELVTKEREWQQIQKEIDTLQKDLQEKQKLQKEVATKLESAEKAYNLSSERFKSEKNVLEEEIKSTEQNIIVLEKDYKEALETVKHGLDDQIKQAEEVDNKLTDLLSSIKSISS